MGTTGFYDVILPDSDAKFSAEKGRYMLYISYMCLFVYRATVVRSLKGLESIIQLVVLDPELGPDGWFFSGRFGTAEYDPLYGFKYLKDLYLKADLNYAGRFSVLLLWDKKNNTAVNNESSELMRMFYTAFDNLLPPELQESNFLGGGLYPNYLRKEIDEWNALIHSNLNIGVYNVGLVSSQDEYTQSVDKLFRTLDQIEHRLQSSGPYLFGDFLTETDLRLYTIVARFDVAYYTIFRYNLKMIRIDYPAIDLWYRSLYYNKSGRIRDIFKATTDFFAYKFGYTKLFATKMGGIGDIVPVGPSPAILPLSGTDEQLKQFLTTFVYPIRVEYRTAKAGGFAILRQAMVFLVMVRKGASVNNKRLCIKNRGNEKNTYQSLRIVEREETRR